MRIIGIAGSPRRHGNSTTLLRQVLAGAAEAGAQGEIIHLNDRLYRGCQDCPVCGREGRCVVTDDLSPVLARLPQADIWALATPIYYDGVCGQLKMFFDRCRHLTRGRDGRLEPQLSGPRAAVIVATYADDERSDYPAVAKVLASYLRWMGGLRAGRDPVRAAAGPGRRGVETPGPSGEGVRRRAAGGRGSRAALAKCVT
jgi:multimeric flavodoxin WrbA